VLAKEGYAAAADRVGLIALDTRQTPQLVAEGIARELQSRLQNLRKEQGLAFEARIVARVVGPEAVIEPARAFAHKIAAEILADRLELEVGDQLADAHSIEVDDWIAFAKIVAKR
jgi:isoleucyl-tRNA synthetase